MEKKNKKWALYVLVLFLLVFGFRLYFALSDPNFSDGSAYINLRNIENVLNEYKPISFDSLSYSGRSVVNPPLFYYIMALLSFGNVFLLKLIPEFLLAAVSLLVFLIAREISKDDFFALISGLLAGFIPLFIGESLNKISVLSFVAPLLLFMFYCSLRLDKDFYLWSFIVCSFLLPLISPLSFLFALAMLTYLFLLGGGFLTATKIKKEAILFSSFLIILINLIVFKKAILEYGLAIIWQNTPVNILSDSFRQLNPFDIAIGLGFLPLIFGAVGAYVGISKEKNKIVYLFAGFMLSILILLVLRLITLPLGLLFLGISLSIFSALGLKAVFDYILKTRLARFFWIFVSALLILVFVSAVIPSYHVAEDMKLNKQIVDDMNWARGNLGSDAVILGNIYEGSFITGIAKRKNVADTDFVLAPRPVERFGDITFIYSTWSEAMARGLLRKYNVGAIYFSEQTKALYNVKELKYAEDSGCFLREGNFYVIKC